MGHQYGEAFRRGFSYINAAEALNVAGTCRFARRNVSNRPRPVIRDHQAVLPSYLPGLITTVSHDEFWTLPRTHRGLITLGTNPIPSLCEGPANSIRCHSRTRENCDTCHIDNPVTPPPRMNTTVSPLSECFFLIGRAAHPENTFGPTDYHQLGGKNRARLCFTSRLNLRIDHHMRRTGLLDEL